MAYDHETWMRWYKALYPNGPQGKRSRYGGSEMNFQDFQAGRITEEDIKLGVFTPQEKERYLDEKKKEEEINKQKEEQDKLTEPGKGRASTIFGGFRLMSPNRNFSLARKTLLPGPSSLLPGASQTLLG